MAYLFQNFNVNQIYTAVHANQVEANVRDHVHGLNGVIKTGISFTRTTKSATFNLTATEVGQLFECTGTYSITFDSAATLGAGWSVTLKSISGVQTLDPSGAETIDGNTTMVLPAAGILVYSDGTNLRTVIGGGAWTPLSSQTASASATIDFTTGINSTYDNYAFILNDVVPATAGQSFNMFTSTDGISFATSSYKDFYYNNDSNDSVSVPAVTYQASGGAGGNADNEIQLCGDDGGISGTNGSGVNGTIFMHNPAAAGDKTMFTWNLVYLDNAVGILAIAAGFGMRDVAEAHTAIRFQMAAGNISSGKFTLYGIKGA